MGKSNVEQLNIAKKYLGNGGSRFRKYCGLPSGSAWCDAFVTTIFAEAGNANLFCGGTKQTYCPTTIKWCRQHLAEVPPYLALPSDIIFFDWEPNEIPNHIGFVRERKDCEAIYTIEGNTSGGIVAEKVRNTKYVCGIYRPHFKATFDASKPLVIDGYFGYHSIAMFQKALGVSVDGVLGQGTVKAWQRKIGASPIDGLWGKTTSKKAQKFLGVTADGYFGPASTKALQRWINKVNGGESATPSTPTVSGKYIGQACADYDHRAGDSSGREVCKSAFKYSSSSTSVYNWTYVFRPKDSAKADKAASMCEKAIVNNNIGYSKSGETAYGKERAMTKLAKEVGYDLSKIKVKCGLSCGDLICLCNHYAGLSTCYIGSGLQLANNLKNNSNFECLKYKNGMTLKRGDTLITAHSNGKYNHVAMVLVGNNDSDAKPQTPVAPSAPTPTDKLVIDGKGGTATVKALQRFLGKTQDGVISGQTKSLKKYYPSLEAVEFGKGGSVCVTFLQKWLGIDEDGIWGQGTSTALQTKLGVTADGIFGVNSMKALQKYLNEHDKAVYPSQTIIDKEMQACPIQADWMKNYAYTWSKWKPRNVAMSAKYGTCVTYVACVLQRIGILKSGQFIWHNSNGKADGVNSKMTVLYMSGSLRTNRAKLKRGDIVMAGDKTDVGEGGNSHIFILNGTWDSKGNPYIWDNQSATRVKKGKNGLHTYGGGKKIIAVIRLK